METVEALKEIYNETAPHLEFCQFTPEFDKKKLETILNLLAKEEEPLSILCVGSAEAKGMLTLLSAGYFLFTREQFYLQKRKKGIKYSDISEISYEEIEKKGLFGKTKKEGHLILKTANGDKEDFIGNYATKDIVEFLNKATDEFRNNPPSPLPQKDHSHADKIANTIKEVLGDNLSGWRFKPDISHNDLNSLIIHNASDEQKSSCSAHYHDKDCDLFFFNEKIYIKTKSSPDSSSKWQNVKYNDLSSVTYEEKDSKNSSEEITTDITLYVYDNKNNPILFTRNSQLATEKNADLFSKIISNERGELVKTNIEKETLQGKHVNEKDKSIAKEIMGGLLDATFKATTGSSLKSQYHLVYKPESWELAGRLLQKWDEIFKSIDSFKIEQTSNSEKEIPEYFAKGKGGKTLLLSNEVKNISCYYNNDNEYYIKYKPETNKELTFEFSLLDDNHLRLKKREATQRKFEQKTNYTMPHEMFSPEQQEYGPDAKFAGYFNMDFSDEKFFRHSEIRIIEMSGWSGVFAEPIKALLKNIGHEDVYESLQIFKRKIESLYSELMRAKEEEKEKKQRQLEEERRKSEEEQRLKREEEQRKKEEEEKRKRKERNEKIKEDMEKIDNLMDDF